MVTPDLEAYSLQYSASINAMQSLQWPTLRNESLPAATDCIAYAERLAALETSLLSKRDQIVLLWLQYRAWITAGQQHQAIECIQKTAAITAIRATKFAFAKLPQIGHADDDRQQVRIMADAAEDEFWLAEIHDKAQAAIKTLRKVANK